jgi:predicted site-specific integrase-resolvase
MSPEGRHMRNIHIARVSEVGQRQPDSLHSPTVQFKKMGEWSQARGDDVLHEWDELDVSAKLPLHRRPKLLRAIEMIEEGDADNLIFAYFDRSVRNIKVQLEIIERIERVKGAGLFVLDRGELTNANAIDRYINTVIGSTNQLYADITGEKVVSAQDEAVALGHYPIAKIPPGFERSGHTLTVVESQVPVITEVFNMRDSVPPATYREIRDYLAEHGIHRSVNGVVSMLGNRIYLGELHFGQHENLTAFLPIIDPDVFDRVQRLKAKGGRRSKSPRLLARLGVLYCGSCGGALIMNAGAGHYGCADNKARKCERKVSIRAERIEEVVKDAVRDYTKDARGRADAETRIREADLKVEQAQANMTAALRVFKGYENAQEARSAIDTAQVDLDTAKRERASLGARKARKLIAPDDIDKLPVSERMPEWRGLITDTGVRVTIHPAFSRRWDDSRIDIKFDVK